MIPDPRLPVSHGRREIVAAFGVEGIVEPQGFRHVRQAVPRDGPVGDFEVERLGAHVVDILGVVRAALGLAGAYELVGLEDDIADAALAHPGVLAAPCVDPVHDHAGHRFHPVCALAAGLALDQPGQQLPVGISHQYITLLVTTILCPSCAAGAGGSFENSPFRPGLLMLRFLSFVRVPGRAAAHSG